MLIADLVLEIAGRRRGVHIGDAPQSDGTSTRLLTGIPCTTDRNKAALHHAIVGNWRWPELVACALSAQLGRWSGHLASLAWRSTVVKICLVAICHYGHQRRVRPVSHPIWLLPRLMPKPQQGSILLPSDPLRAPVMLRFLTWSRSGSRRCGWKSTFAMKPRFRPQRHKRLGKRFRGSPLDTAGGRAHFE